jgi:hypothetical protein
MSRHHRLIECDFRDYGKQGETGAGFYVYGSQSHNHLILRSRFNGGDRGLNKLGYWGDYGAWVTVLASHFEANNLDIFCDTFVTMLRVEGCTSLNSAKFAVIGKSSSSSSMPTVIRSSSVRTSYLGVGRGGPEHTIIELNGIGPLVVMGNDLRADNVNPAIRSDGITNSRAMVLAGNRFRGPNPYYKSRVSHAYSTGLGGSGTTLMQAGVDFSGGRLAVWDGGNYYWNPTTEKHERLFTPDIRNISGRCSMGARNFPRNHSGQIVIPAGSQEGYVELPNPEIDERYVTLVGVSSYASTPADADLVSAFTKAGWAKEGFWVRLSGPAPVDTTVDWEIARVRAA